MFIKLKNSLKKINKNIKTSSKNSDKLYMVIFFDMLICKIIYQIDSYEYTLYELYNLSYNKRKTYLSKFKYNLRCKLYNDKDIIINTKNKLYIRFKEYLNREVYNINDLSYKEFENIIKSNKKILCRSLKSSFINSYKIYNLNDFRGPGFILDDIKKNNLFLIEESFKQNKSLDKISKSLVVINVSLLLDEVLSITLSYKENNKEIKCFVDIDKYITKGHFRCDNKIYNKEINEYRVPHLKEIINLSIKMSKELNVNNELKWSYCLSDSGKIYYMDTDNFDDLEFIQIPEYLNNNIGFLPRYIKAVKRTK